MVAWSWATWSDPEFALSGGFGPKFSTSVKGKKGMREGEEGGGTFPLQEHSFDAYLVWKEYNGSSTEIAKKKGLKFVLASKIKCTL